MVPSAVYVLHPDEPYFPSFPAWVEEVRETLDSDPSFQDCRLITVPFDSRQSFKVKDVYTRVVNLPGPVILVQKVQGRAKEMLREKLQRLSIVHVCSVNDPTDLYAAIVQARDEYATRGVGRVPRC